MDRKAVNKRISEARRAGSSVGGASVEHRAEYLAWSNMIARCCRVSHPDFKNYGGRGITVCNRWRSFHNFLTDMGPRPGPNMTLERANNHKGYNPTNCLWASRASQNRNHRRNVVVEYKGVKYCVTDLAKKFDIEPNTLKSRLASGWTLNDALSTKSSSKHGSVTKPDRVAKGSRHGLAKLTESIVAECRKRRRMGESTSDLAIEYGVHQATLRKVISGRSWRHVL